MLADMLTVREEFGSVRGASSHSSATRGTTLQTRSWSCARSWGCTSAPAARRSLCPRRRFGKCRAVAAETGAVLEFTDDIRQGRRTVTPCIRIYGFPWASPQNCGCAHKASAAVSGQQGAYGHGEARGHLFLHCSPSFHDRETTVGERYTKKRPCGDGGHGRCSSAAGAAV